MFSFLDLITNNYFLKQKLKIDTFNSPVRRLTDNWQGISTTGQKIINGKINLKLSNSFSKFNFLRDLKSEGSIKARSLARSLVDDWINQNINLRSKDFNPDIMAERVACWCFNYSWFGESGELNFQKKVLNSIAFQTKFLELKLNEQNSSFNKILIIKAIIVAKSILYDDVDEINELLETINKSLDLLINPDGGHISRNPAKQLFLLRQLVEIRSVVAILKNINAENLHNQTIKMGQFCRSFQMPDENFSWFHGGSLIEKHLIKQTLNRIGYKNRIFNIANDTGYCRLSCNETVVFVDIGLHKKLSSDSKASLFAFELFYKKEKLISNLGDIKASNIKSMRDSLASSAAHSTLNIDDRNNVDLTGKRKTKVFDLRYGKTKEGNLIDATHSGYGTIYGVNHQRQICVSQMKNEVKGKDKIISVGNVGTIPKNAYIRFHICPDIELIKTRNGSILLKHLKGFVWKMTASNNNISIQDSVMFGPNGPIQCKEIMIIMRLETIRAHKSISCDWAFQLQS